MMNRNYITSMTGLAFCIVLLLSSCDDDPKPDHGPKAVAKTNTMKVYMHYMPWFQSKEVSGYWGSHWKMANKNPEIVDANGKREIASHYYPLIGPYDSKDPDVIEYHLLLMKYAGVDGILIDWYGSHNVNDFRVNLIGSNAIIDKVDDTGLSFGIVYEDFTAGVVEDKTTKTALEAGTADMDYLKTNYFTNSQYIKIDDAPLLLTFGPREFKTPDQWSQMFSSLSPKPKFLPLWGHGAYTGDNDSGEYSWIDFTDGQTDLDNFYNKVFYMDVMIGSAFPRFHDYYVEGGVGSSYGYVDYSNGDVLRNTLAKATQRQLKYLQLATWNDFGEGTIMEPTLEDEYECLEILQDYTGVSYGREELELIHEYYLKKKEYKTDTAVLEKLAEVFDHLVALEVDEAKAILEEIP